MLRLSVGTSDSRPAERHLYAVYGSTRLRHSHVYVHMNTFGGEHRRR